MSDLHLTSNRTTLWGADTHAHFKRAIESIRKLDNIDCIIVSGDIAHDGNKDIYEYVDNELKKIGAPTFWCPGNHDDINAFYRHVEKSSSIIVSPTVINGFLIIPLNSVAQDEKRPDQNRARGVLDSATLTELEILLSSTNLACIIFFHHPSIEPGGWLSEKILINREEFNLLVSKYANVRLVLYGHIHYHTQFFQHNSHFISSPAIGYAFNKELPKFKIAEGEEGYTIIELNDKEINIDIKRI